MKKKRPTPRKLPSGRWRCQVRADGKVISVTDDDPKICQAKAMAIQAGAMQKEAKPKSITLKNAIEEYISSKSNTLSPSTVRGYEQVKNNRFKDLMNKNVYNITKRDVQEAVNQESETVSPKTVSNAYGVIRPVLKEYGVDVFGVSLPRKSKPRKEYLQIDEIGKLIEASQGDKCEIEILLAIWLGMRRSEIIGLCWDCIDDERETITVMRTMVPDKSHRMVLKEMTKNKSSNRTLKCPGYIMDKLKERRNGRTGGLVFNVHPDTLRKHIHRVCEKAGVTDTTTHGLRHTNAAVMQNLGVSTQHAMKRNGWSEERTYKNLYSYAFDSVADRDDEMIDAFYEDKIKNVTQNVTRKTKTL